MVLSDWLEVWQLQGQGQSEGALHGCPGLLGLLAWQVYKKGGPQEPGTEQLLIVSRNLVCHDSVLCWHR